MGYYTWHRSPLPLYAIEEKKSHSVVKGEIAPKMKPNSSSSLLLISLLYFGVILHCSVEGRLFPLSKPTPTRAVAYARWLVSQNSWGVLSTISSDLGGAPFGNVVSYSDGLPGEGKGVPYFYLTTLDPTAANALKDQRSSMSISEYPLGTCGKADPENPTCAKITLTGKLRIVKEDDEEAVFAKTALFAKHTEMKGWPLDHNFQIFKLDIEDIFLINWFGGPKPITVDEYLHFTMNSQAILM